MAELQNRRKLPIRHLPRETIGFPDSYMNFFNGLFRRPGALLVAFGLSVCSTGEIVVHAQNAADPSDIWYKGFLANQAAQGMAENGEYLAAFNKLGEALPQFNLLAQQYPEYLPEIVRERRNLIMEQRDELKVLMSRPKPAPQLPQRPAPSYPQPQVGNPGGNYNGGNSGVPGVRIAPPPTTPSYHGSSREGSMEIIPEGEFSLPEWDQGSSQALPRQGIMTGPSAPNLPRVENRRPNSVAGIANSLHDELKRKDEMVNWLQDKNYELQTELDKQKSLSGHLAGELRDAKRARDQHRADYDQARKLQASQEQVQELKGLLAGANQLIDKLLSQNERILGELEASKKEISAMKDRMAEVEKQRDNLLEIVEGGGNGGKALKELMDRNRELSAKLDRAESLAKSLSETNNEKDEDIKMLKSEIASIKAERDNLLNENLRHQQEIESAKRKLELLSDGLTAEEKNALANASPLERQENEMLRSVVLKQLRTQARKMKAKELLIEQLEKLGGRSDTLLGLVEDIARGSQLTEEEKALFRSPHFREIIDAAGIESSDVIAAGANADDGTASMSATIVAAGNAPAAPGENGVIADQKLSVELSQLDKSARLDFKEGRYAEAEAGFLKYLHYRPKNVGCLCNLGVLKITMKNYSEAEYYLEKALAIESKSGLANYLLGRAYFMQGRLDEALTKLEAGITYDPQNAKAHNSVGVISTQKGWVDRAERAFTNAVSIDPEYGDAHFNLAVLHATKDQPNPNAAGKHYLRAIQLGVPRDAQIEGFIREYEAQGLSVGLR